MLPYPYASLPLCVPSSPTFAVFDYRQARSSLAIPIELAFLATLWFLYLQAFVLHAFCPFCLASAAVTFVLAGLMVATTPGKPLSA